ncbi:MAG: threonylcarbamoyl-AMP synthase [Bacteroidales bacterium]|jgi:tRNA threonylcarbamoyl adenosine modification protein (Sua5/YciO/YrdC/YwlC family)|nr:threonylcarbamoyl-AMP synthase [Bacteroidales bacterium]
MLITIHPDSPEPRKMEQVVACLEKGGIVVYPTDTLYGIGCDITNAAAVQKILKFKDVNLRKTNLTFICHDLSHAAQYVRPISSRTFRLMKKNTPGPFTFIVEASSSVPKIFKSGKKTVGVRIPDSNIILELVQRLGRPILSTSVKVAGEETEDEYLTDPSLIQERLGHIADIVIDGGIGSLDMSTVVDCTTDDWEIIRQGKAELDDAI